MKKVLLSLIVFFMVSSVVGAHSENAPSDPVLEAPENPSQGNQSIPSLPDAASGIAKSVTDTVNNFLGSTAQGLGGALQDLLGGNQTETPQTQ